MRRIPIITGEQLHREINLEVQDNIGCGFVCLVGYKS